MLKRLQDQKSHYDIEKWQSDRVRNLGIVNMRTKYDYVMMSQKQLRNLRSNSKKDLIFPLP